MNKQELIERIKKLDEPYLKAEFVLELVKQLDEPEKSQSSSVCVGLVQINKDNLDKKQLPIFVRIGKNRQMTILYLT